MPNVTIGCKLPHGTVMETGIPGTKNYAYVVLNGTLNALPKAKYGSTRVDSEVWNAWKKQNASLRYLCEGSLFEVPLVQPVARASRKR